MNNHEMMALDEKQNAEFEELVKYCMTSGAINLDLYEEYDVKRGLRDANGKGVLTGLTEISDVVSYKSIDGVKTPIDGELYYQGYNVADLIEGLHGRRYAFEETTYLLLFGELPTAEQLERFIGILSELQELYAYHSYRHFKMDDVLLIRNPDKNCSTAENILRMLRPDGKYTELEARVLDVALVLHAEHGGGNNSTFTTHVVTSSGTDTYSTIAASIASLKGPKHGGANLKVTHMIENIKENVKDWEDEAEIEEYLAKILDKQAFDGAGLIYGMGHAVYTLSDPREVILKRYAKSLSEEKELTREFELLERIERIAGKLIAQRRRLFKPICANVDFYSGFVYTMLGIPEELFTPIFAISRISGWSAHRLEELVNKGKIIRPAYKYVGWHKPYYDIEHRLGDVNDNWK